MSAYRDRLHLFEAANAQVLGISVDSFAAVGEFEDKISAEFPLLSDFPSNQAGKDYGVYNEQFGIHNRVTVVVDSDRIVQDVHIEPADMESHPKRALEVLKGLGDKS
ncbi:MAG TPA: redoxin domain-containing protein [Dehalococcoidia bacterium]|jgi:peroxiredoxin|nr:redoxin domain-containing protein [Dehalococcoidia bacterium]